VPGMRHAAGPEVKIMKIELRRLHRAFSHLRSLFLPLRIVKQSAFDSKFSFSRYFRRPAPSGQIRE
jgi:hypothetical protein